MWKLDNEGQRGGEGRDAPGHQGDGQAAPRADAARASAQKAEFFAKTATPGKADGAGKKEPARDERLPEGPRRLDSRRRPLTGSPGAGGWRVHSTCPVTGKPQSSRVVIVKTHTSARLCS